MKIHKSKNKINAKEREFGCGALGCVLLLVAPSLSHEGGYRQIHKKSSVSSWSFSSFLISFLRNHKIYYKYLLYLPCVLNEYVWDDVWLFLFLFDSNRHQKTKKTSQFINSLSMQVINIRVSIHWNRNIIY